MCSYRSPDPYSDITIISSDGVKFYYSKFVISKSSCKYLKTLALGNFAEGTSNVINISVDSYVLDVVLSVCNRLTYNSYEKHLFKKLLKFCDMACWHRPFRQVHTIEFVKSISRFYKRIVNMYPKVIKFDHHLRVHIIEYLKNATSLKDINPKIFKHIKDYIKLFEKYIKDNNREYVYTAFKYCMKYGCKKEDSYIILSAIKLISDDKKLECLNMIKMD